jgi:hypothetical protein
VVLRMRCRRECVLAMSGGWLTNGCAVFWAMSYRDEDEKDSCICICLHDVVQVVCCNTKSRKLSRHPHIQRQEARTSHLFLATRVCVVFRLPRLVSSIHCAFILTRAVLTILNCTCKSRMGMCISSSQSFSFTSTHYSTFHFSCALPSQITISVIVTAIRKINHPTPPKSPLKLCKSVHHKHPSTPHSAQTPAGNSSSSNLYHQDQQPPPEPSDGTRRP